MFSFLTDIQKENADVECMLPQFSFGKKGKIYHKNSCQKEGKIINIVSHYIKEKDQRTYLKNNFTLQTYVI